VECPSCEHLVRTSYSTYYDNADSNTRNDLRCNACFNYFCRIHGTMHSSMSCYQYQLTPEARRLGESEVALATWTKPCSHCGCRLQKSSGCDHVVCLSCGHDLCWKCGTHVHLTGTVVRTCGQCQRAYRDHRYDAVYRRRLAYRLPLLVPLLLVYAAVAAALAIVTGCFCGCFACGRCLEFNKLQQQQQQQQQTETSNNTHAGSSNSGGSSSGSGNVDTDTGVSGSDGSSNNNNSPRTSKNSNVTKSRGSIRHGVWTTIVVVFLPIICVLEEFGFHMRVLDELFPEPFQGNNEMPYLDVDMNTTSNVSTEEPTPPESAVVDLSRGNEEKA
jgi:hypothetical protein